MFEMDIRLPHCYAYARPAVTADSLIFCALDRAHKILLIRRKEDPFKGRWALPGGFMEMDETTEQAAHRELQEETGLSGVTLERVDIFDAPDRDPRGRLITVAYTGWIEPAQAAQVTAGDDAATIGWHALDALPELAFDHAQIITAALQQAASRCHGTD